MSSDPLRVLLASACSLYAARLERGRNLRRAAQFRNRALHLLEDASQSNPNRVLRALQSLAATYRKIGKYGEAEGLYQRALKLIDSHPNADVETSIYTLRGLARIYQEQGRFGASVPLLERARVQIERSYGAIAPGVAAVLQDLGNSFAGQGQYRLASDCYRSGYDVAVRAAGAGSRQAASIQASIGTLLQEQGHYREAERMLEESIRVLERLGDERESLAPRGNMASLHLTMGRRSTARLAFEKTLALAENVWGPADGHLVPIINNLAACYAEEHGYAKAQELFLRALAIGDNQPELRFDRGLTLANLASVYRQQGRLELAEAMARQALGIVEAFPGADPSEVAHLLDTLATVYFEQRRLEEADRLERRAIDVKQQAVGLWHLELAPMLNRLGNIAATGRDFSEAKRHYLRARAIAERADFTPPVLGSVLQNLAMLEERAGNTDEAASLYRRAANIYETVRPMTSEAAEARASLDSFLRRQGHNQSAAT